MQGLLQDFTLFSEVLRVGSGQADTGFGPILAPLLTSSVTFSITRFP